MPIPAFRPDGYLPLGLHMLVTRQPQELFGVFTRERWEAWLAFFGQTREIDGRRKGLVEVIL